MQKMEQLDKARSAGTEAPRQAKRLIPYGGYYANRIPAHDPELTETGPGTPMGEYMRGFWHPVCMSMELTHTCSCACSIRCCPT